MGKASKLSIVPSSPWEIDPDVIKREKFSSWRKYQRETVEAVLKSEKPFVLLSAPTGSGKSLIAVSLGLLWHKLKGEKVIITTKDTDLQKQYEKDFNIPVIMGRKNYPCQFLTAKEEDRRKQTERTAEDCPFDTYGECPIVSNFISFLSSHSEAFLEDSDAFSEKNNKGYSLTDLPVQYLKWWEKEFPEEEKCEYVIKRELARKLPVALLNNHYFYTVYKIAQSKLWEKPSLLIIDEAHNFPDFLIEMASKKFPLRSIEKLSERLTAHETLLERAKTAFEGMAEETKQKYENMFKERLEESRKLFKQVLKEQKARISLLEEMIKQLIQSEEDKYEPDAEKIEVVLSKASAEEIIQILSEVGAGISRLASVLSELAIVLTNIELEARARRNKTISDTRNSDMGNKVMDLIIGIVGKGEYTPKELEELNTLYKELSSRENKIERKIEGLYSFVIGIADIIRASKSITKFVEKYSAQSHDNILYAEDIRKTKVEEKDYLFVLYKEQNKSNTSYGLELKAIFPKREFRELWETLGKPKIVFMSATLFPPYFEKMLGISQEEYEYYDIPSTFPPENRPIIYIPWRKINSKFFQNEENVKKYINLIDITLDIFFEQGLNRGVILITKGSHADLFAESKHKNKLIFTRGNFKKKEQALTRHSNLEKSILISPSLWEGVDLKDDLSRFQIIFKVPFGYLGDKSVEVRKKIDNEWYVIDALNKLIQGVGRSVRSPNDYAITIIFDKNFGILRSQYEKHFPQWFLESKFVKITARYETLLEMQLKEKILECIGTIKSHKKDITIKNFFEFVVQE
ncbi:MAG: hypothetical protein DRP08_03245 [Candidatus Aenigmatarchaeota archaeon]|nr:MAG: hypothetical protein DRP08_03245 [Candidatus Aenigmarchaeota archaeon]